MRMCSMVSKVNLVFKTKERNIYFFVALLLVSFLLIFIPAVLGLSPLYTLICLGVFLLNGVVLWKLANKLGRGVPKSN
jgi:hypothetical protein